jgi:hypothetical protein
MRKLLPLLLVFMLVLAACGGDDDDDDDVGGIEDAESCDDVGNAFLDEMQVLLDELSDVSISDFSGDEQPEAMTNFESAIDDISAKADELECSDEEMADFLRDNLDELEADGPVAELLLDSFREGVESGEIFE